MPSERLIRFAEQPVTIFPARQAKSADGCVIRQLKEIDESKRNLQAKKPMPVM